jgi:hypothetical protein
LVSTIEEGFPELRHLTSEAVKSFYNVKEHLWTKNGVIMFKNRVVIPKSLRPAILRTLHSAHQGIEGMRLRAANTVYWPGINNDIKQSRKNCKACDYIAPSQAQEPLQLIAPSVYPFQQICADAFEISGVYYVAVVDRFSGWILIYHFRTAITSQNVIRILRSVFTSYGAASRILMNNLGPGGTINTDNASKALLQYRNTPLKGVGLSPAQILFHRNLRDSIPVDPQSLRTHKTWLIAANNRERAFEQQHKKLTARYNTFAKALHDISVGSKVIIQDPISKRWNRCGKVVEVEGRKYTIRVAGSNRIITRNRRFLKPMQGEDSSDMSHLIHGNNYETPNDISVNDASDSGTICVNAPTPSDIGTTQPAPIPLMLRRLQPYNQPGLKETTPAM